MGMFGGFDPTFGGRFTPPLVEDQQADLSRGRVGGLFGTGATAAEGVAPVKPAALAGFTPYHAGLIDKVGLIGDVLGGGTTGQQLLAQKQGQAALAYSAAHPAPMTVGDTVIDPVTHQVLFDGRKPAAPHYFEANNGDQFQVGPDGKPQLVYKDPTPKVTWQEVDNGDGRKTLYPVVNGQIMTGSAPTPAPSGVTFTPLPAKGGAAPATGPAGFPLYPAGHRRSGAR